MIRVLWFFILVVILYWALRELFARDGRRSRPGIAGEEMVKDPNCGVYLPVSSAILVQKGREKLYFCSEECRKSYADRTGGRGRKAKE